MIIDGEVHNVKDSISTLLPPHLDLKLLNIKKYETTFLLSATPMFNKADEIYTL